MRLERLQQVEAPEGPSHFVERNADFAAFFDGDGLARVFGESSALAGEGNAREVDAEAPHHGAVIPFGDYDVISVPDSEDSSNPPVGVRVLDRDGSQVGEITECIGLHGEATSGNLIAIGCCADGILVVHSTGGVPSVEPLTFTEGLGEGRVSTLLGGRGLQYFLGNFDPSTVAIIDPAEDDAFRLVELPTRRVDFAVDNVRARFAYIFTENGQLHQLDIDRFKSINDRFGHQMGDRIIILAAQTIEASLRKNDKVFRVGGVEFVCLLPDTTLPEAYDVAERVRATFQRIAETVDGKAVEATISIGVAATDGSFSASKLFSIADDALYMAKRSGRNRSVMTRLPEAETFETPADIALDTHHAPQR